MNSPDSDLAGSLSVFPAATSLSDFAFSLLCGLLLAAVSAVSLLFASETVVEAGAGAVAGAVVVVVVSIVATVGAAVGGGGVDDDETSV